LLPREILSKLDSCNLILKFPDFDWNYGNYLHDV
jgi:hypothetical protein